MTETSPTDDKTPADVDTVWHGRQYQMQPVQKDQRCNITTVDGLEDVGKHPQGSGLRGVARPETRLERLPQITPLQVVNKLLGDESLQQLRPSI